MSSLLVTKVICPHCHAELDARAALCGQCGGNLAATPSLANTDKRIIDRPWLIVVVLLHVGFLGIPLYLKTGYSLTTRILLCVASVVYTVVAVAIIIWGLAQIAKVMP